MTTNATSKKEISHGKSTIVQGNDDATSTYTLFRPAEKRKPQPVSRLKQMWYTPGRKNVVKKEGVGNCRFGDQTEFMVYDYETRVEEKKRCENFFNNFLIFN